MTTTLDSAALARAYADGIEQGLQLASDRVLAYLEGLSGERHDYFADVIRGAITAEMVRELERQREPVTADSQVLH